MSKERNCPNCGAAYEVDKNECPYCGTSYFDMSALNFEDGTPFYLKIKTVTNNKPVYLTMFVKPKLGAIELETESQSIFGKYGEKMYSFDINRMMTTNISFVAIPDKDGTLAKLEMCT